jgi:hypothetical protein
MREIIEQELRAKCQEHSELAAKEAELSISAASIRNDQWRVKKQGDRKLVSQRATKVLREIEGLASILGEKKYEQTTA